MLSHLYIVIHQAVKCGAGVFFAGGRESSTVGHSVMHGIGTRNEEHDRCIPARRIAVCSGISLFVSSLAATEVAVAVAREGGAAGVSRAVSLQANLSSLCAVAAALMNCPTARPRSHDTMDCPVSGSKVSSEKERHCVCGLVTL